MPTDLFSRIMHIFFHLFACSHGMGGGGRGGISLLEEAVQ